LVALVIEQQNGGSRNLKTPSEHEPEHLPLILLFIIVYYI